MVWTVNRLIVNANRFRWIAVYSAGQEEGMGSSNRQVSLTIKLISKKQCIYILSMLRE